MHSTCVHVLYVVLLHMEIVGGFGTRWGINNSYTDIGIGWLAVYLLYRPLLGLFFN